ncbi:MAG: hypothetical protein C5B44_04760 [Acidobacteria bacterium]|nr:MAG: hypothetical protein C5B44_04760 [Acidobacteriota bacterium]
MGLLGRAQQLNNRTLLGAFAALILLAALQILPIWSGDGVRQGVSLDPFATRLWILYTAALLIVLALLLQYTNDLTRLRALVYVVVAVGVGSAVFGIGRHLTYFVLPVPAGSTSAEASFGQFINRNHFALLMELSLGLVAGILVGGGTRTSHIPIYLTLTALLWTALVLSNSRGGIMSMVGQSIFLALIWNLRREPHRRLPDGRFSSRLKSLSHMRGTRALLTVGLVAIMAVGVVWVGGDPLRHRFEALPRELESETVSRDNSSRLSIWRATLNMIKDHPLAGVGFGAFATAFPRYHNASGRWTPEQAHNDYLELMASGGLPAVAIGIVILITVGRTGWRRFTAAVDPFRRATCLGALVGLFGLMIHSLVDFGLHITVNALVCISLIVIAIAPVSESKAATRQLNV